MSTHERHLSFLWQSGAWLCSAVTLTLTALLWWQASIRKSNNIGFDIQIFWMISLIGLVISIAAYYSTRTLTLCITVLFMSALVLAITLFVLDYWNVLVEYDTWLQRGMPDKWQP